MTLRTLVVVGLVIAAVGLALKFVLPGDSSNDVAGEPSPIEQANTAAVGSNLRNVAVAIETYRTSTGGYDGMTIAALSAIDPASASGVRVAWATHDSYCVESTVGPVVESKSGPAADIVTGPCPSP